MAERKTAPSYCIQHTRFAKQDDWRLLDLSVDWYKYIAVSGYNRNTHQTSIDVYSISSSVSRRKPEILFSQEFKKYLSKGKIYRGRLVSFETDSDNIVTCLGDKLEVIQVSESKTLRCCKLNGNVTCLFVTKNEIYIGFFQSRQISVYDVKELYKIRNINLEGIQKGDFPFDLTSVDDKFVACVGQDNPNIHSRSLLFGETNGNILCEFTNPTGAHWYANSVTVCEPLGVVAVVWFNSYYIREETHFQIVFYSLKNENNFNFLVAEDESVSRIRISDRGERLVSGNQVTGEVKLYDMAEIFSYEHMKEYLATRLRRNECEMLTRLFALPNDQTEVIMKSETPMEDLTVALEEKDVIQPSSVHRLIEALKELKIDSSHYIIADIYQKIKMQATRYDRFIAILATHLTASLPADLCIYFNIPDDKKSSIKLSQDPGLSLLLALDKMDIINSSDTTALEQPFTKHRLVQAVAKIHEYQSTVEEERKGLIGKDAESNTLPGKARLFIRYLQRKVNSWYETMTPLPWKKSCRWKSTDLFVACGLILTDSKNKRNLTDIDDQCKLRYTEIFIHKKLKGESRIILEGEPGSGKTMLSSQFAYDWSQGNISGINILIFLPLKFVENKTLVEAVRDFYLPEDNLLSLCDIEDIIANEENKCCFLLDGLEEYNGGKTSTVEEPSEIMKIMTKKQYPSCKVVITSRSDYAQDLPHCPILRIGQFGEFERNTYIETVFAGDLEKQLKVKEAVENTPFILDLCKTPLLFVLAVHIIVDKKNVRGQLNRVTPFMRDIIKSLHRPDFFLEDVSKVELLQSKSESISLEKLAFNGLCKGNKQLSWSKSFVDNNVKHIKHWIDSGIVVVEEPVNEIEAAQNTTQKAPKVKGTKTPFDKDDPSPTTSLKHLTEISTDNDASPKEDFIGNTQQVISEDGVDSLPLVGETRMLRTISLSFGMTEREEKSNNSKSALEENVELPTHQNNALERQEDDQSTIISYREEDVNETFALKHVPLQVKFLHKVIQEWFAARYLASVCWGYTSLPWLKQYEFLRKHLYHINPADLHYVLRFTCSLCPPCCHFVLNYLLVTYRSKEGDIPEYILNCICLCLAEYEDDKGDYLKDLVSEVCKMIFIIRSGDSRLVQAGKVDMLHFASNCGFPISELQLQDVVITAQKDELTLNSGVTLSTLPTLKVIGMRRWDQTLGEEDYKNILTYIATSTEVTKANLHFPVPPPSVSDKKILDRLELHHTSVTWMIGSRLSLELDTTTGEWKTNLQTVESTPEEENDETNVTGTVVDLHTEGFIDERGGTLFLREADISLHVPAGALTWGYVIRIIVPMNFSSCFPGRQVSPRVTPLIICEPDNLLFKSPVKLTLPHCAVIQNPDNHNVSVKFGYKDDNKKEMIWKSETVDWSLGEHYCSLSLYHFSGVDVGISSTEEKILRVIPYTKLRRNNKLSLNVWLCNDLESDFQSVMQTEETNAGIPLDSYDTFRLNYVSGPEISNVTVSLKELKSSSWNCQKNEDTIHKSRLSKSTKSKSNFQLIRTDGEGDESYMYLLLRVHQIVGQEERETTFAIRKMICDLTAPVMFNKPCSQYEHETDHLLPTEKQPRTYTAVVYMDPVKDPTDDAILTLWLSPFDSASHMFQIFQKEQELQLKHRVDTENSFLVFDDKIAVVSKTRFLNGQWSLSPEEKKIGTDRIRFASRAKFQFIGRRERHVDSDYIDLEVELFQEEENKIKFTTDVEMDDLLYEIRRKKLQDSTASASEETSTFSSEVQSDRPHQSVTKSLQVTNIATVPSTPVKHVAVANAPLSQSEGQSRTPEEVLQNCFMFLKRNLAMDWKDVGRCLHLSEDELSRLSKDNKDDVGECIYQMLLCWQRKSASRATHEKIVEALKKVNRSDLAEKLPTE